MTSLPALRTRAAFLLGLSLSLLPSLGPIAVVLLLFSRRWTLERRDLLWAASALAFGLAAGVTSGVSQALLGVGTVAGAWIVFRTFAHVKVLEPRGFRRGPLALGLLAGFAVVVVVGLLRSVAGLDLATTRALAPAIDWQRSPALYGHAVLVLGGIIALLTERHRGVAWAAMGLAAFGVLVSGSREAAIAWLALALLQIALRPAGARRPRLTEAFVVAAMLGVSAGLAPVLGWGRIGFLLAPATPAEAPRNLLAGTEVPRGDWWDDRWVDVAATTERVGGQELTVYDVTKQGEAPWLRLQQLVRLEPGGVYTLSGWVDPAGDAVAGFQGWGEPAPGTDTFVLDAALTAGAWEARAIGPGGVVAASELARDGPWRRVAVTFRYDADAVPITWFVGFTPDARPRQGGSARLAGLMLEEGATAGPYVPGAATAGLDFRYARAPLWRAAWQGIRERPLTGWGAGAFADAYRASRPDVERQQLVPAHPHNLVLWILFERGLIGLAGLGLLLVGLFGLAVRYRDMGVLSVAIAILIANLFDATLLSGAVLYPLAAVAGWRSALRGARRSDGTEGLRQATVRVSLAATDTLVPFVGLLLAQSAAGAAGTPFELGAPLLYALLVWPALASREGLYPGYGLTPAQELRKQTTAWAFASVLMAAGTRLFPEALALPPVGLAVLLAATLIGGPVGRAGVKRLLYAMRIWGRPVVILGAGDTGRRVARALQRTPLDGLHPLAFFDDHVDTQQGRIEGLRVHGDLDEAAAFARRHHVQHAIVAISSLGARRLDRLVTGSGRVFRRVQFVPKLGALPSEDVVATGLDGMLALEVRNGLFSPVNRAVKRAADAAGAVTLGLAASPLLLALWAWVRLDSPGGGFHRSQRIGQDGRRFACLKFRTMHEDAEARLQEILATDPARRAEYERWHKLDDDPRVTRAGRFLRRTSLDELPQLWNVLKGEMSLVGPRPYLARELPDMGAYRDILLQAKPGMTGHWQVSARSSVTFAERLEIEAHYVRNWSVWWDIVLMVQTPMAVLRSEGEAK